MTDLFNEPEGATPLAEEDREGLKRTDIALRAELNVAEAENILAGRAWAFQRLRRTEQLLTRDTLRLLHRRMFGQVWRWAGNFRTRETNIGCPPYRIATELEALLLNVQAQTTIPAQLPWPAQEVAVRFHHQLVSIHPFVNGNGRHARLASDLLVRTLGAPPLTWGHAGALTEASEARARYIAALRVADRDMDYTPLLKFARS